MGEGLYCQEGQGKWDTWAQTLYPQGAEKTIPERWAQRAETLRCQPLHGGRWGSELCTLSVTAPENVPGLGKNLGLAKEGRELGTAREEGGALGREGSPALACPLSPPRTLPGSLGAAAAAAGRPRIASLPGRAAPARSASARNRARPRGPRAAGARGRPSSGTLRRAGTQARGRNPRAGTWSGDRGRGRAQAEVQSWGQGLWWGVGTGGWMSEDLGSGTRCRRTAGPRPGIPGAGPARGVGRGADLTACEEARRGAGRADGRTEEFAAGGEVGWVRLRSLPLYTSPGEERLPWAQMGQETQVHPVRSAGPGTAPPAQGRRPARLGDLQRPPPTLTPRSRPACGNAVSPSEADQGPGGPGRRCAPLARAPGWPVCGASLKGA